jgi:hypothetical protein
MADGYEALYARMLGLDEPGQASSGGGTSAGDEGDGDGAILTGAANRDHVEAPAAIPGR